MVTLKGDWKRGEIEPFKIRDGVYRFPFTPLDPTPGGRSLGRMEWCIEPIRRTRKREGRYWIDSILVWATQTSDPRYFGIVFEIPCMVDCVTSHRLSDGSYFAGVWRTVYCEQHRNVVFDSYPENHHTGLIVNVFVSSASVEYD